MLDILAAVLEELLGTKKPPQSQPRRRVRPGESGGSATGPTVWREPEPREQPPEFEDMVKKFFGIEEEEALPEPEPVRPPTRVSERQAVADPVYWPSEPKPTEEPPAQISGTFAMPAAPVPEAAVPSAGRPATAGELAARLRNNPAAAREAFIYSEIFGPPLAER